MRSLFKDVRYGLRMLLRSPGFTAAALVCITLGIGATTAIFSVVQAVVMRPLRYREPERLVRVYSEFPTFPGGGLRKFWTSAPEFLELRRETRSWEALEAWVVGGVNLAGVDQPVRATAANVSGGMLRMLGVDPLRGRLHTDEDDRPGAAPAIVISQSLWQGAFGAAPDIVGRETKLNGRTSTIIGVMPAGFHFPPGEVDPPEVWVPLRIDPANPGGRGSHYLYLLGRLKPGTSASQAQDELASLVQSWGSASGSGQHSFRPQNHTIVSSPLHEEVVASVRPAMYALLAAVGFVLLIACVNVANLLLARAEVRRREIAIRRALGAATPALVRQFVVEGLLLALVGAAGGLGVAYGGLRLMLAFNPGNIPRVAEIALDGRVLLFTLAVSIATGVLFGLAPLGQLVAGSLNEALKPTSGRTTSSVESNRIRQSLVVVELAMALVLLIGTGLTVAAFWKLQAVPLGFEPEGLVTMRVALPTSSYADATRVEQFWTAVQERLATLPAAESISVMAGLPPGRPVNANDTDIEGFVPRPGGPIQNIDYYQTVGNRFFETLRIPLMDGRFFDERDGPGAPPAVIVNQTMARTFYPETNAIGRRIRPSGSKEWSTIVGVVADVKNAGIEKPAGTEIFLPYHQAAARLRNGTIVLRARGSPGSVVAAARGRIGEIDPSLPVANVRTMDDIVSASRARPRFLTLLLGIFSSVALALAAVGIYGVMSYSVAQRTSEFGIRMAIGAQQSDVLRMVLAQGMKLGLAGVAAGAAGAFGLTRFMRRLLFGIDAFDPATFLLMGGLLLAVTLLACYIPARRATRVDPLVALRYE